MASSSVKGDNSFPQIHRAASLSQVRRAANPRRTRRQRIGDRRPIHRRAKAERRMQRGPWDPPDSPASRDFHRREGASRFGAERRAARPDMQPAHPGATRRSASGRGRTWRGWSSRARRRAGRAVATERAGVVHWRPARPTARGRGRLRPRRGALRPTAGGIRRPGGGGRPGSPPWLNGGREGLYSGVLGTQQRIDACRTHLQPRSGFARARSARP